jgi:hypothetical protein
MTVKGNIRAMKSGKEKQTASIGKINAYKYFVRKPEWKMQLKKASRS